MDFDEFATSWKKAGSDLTLDGYTISSCKGDVENEILYVLQDIVSLLHCVVCDVLKIHGDRLVAFASATYSLLGIEIEDCINDFKDDWADNNFDEQSLYVNACRMTALGLEELCEKADLLEKWESVASNNRVIQKLRAIETEFGSDDAVHASIALAGITLATRLIRAREIQFAWIAAVQVNGIANRIFWSQSSEDCAKRRLAHLGVSAKLARDPRQKEKKFIRECWVAWKKAPEKYASKAAFARDMLLKCDHLTSQKKIEDWCREWESQLS